MGGDGTVPLLFFFRDHDSNQLMIVEGQQARKNRRNAFSQSFFTAIETRPITIASSKCPTTGMKSGIASNGITR